MSKRRIVRHEGGTSAIEFGLTLPIFLFIMMAIIEGGLLMWTQFGLQNGVEKAARCASINGPLCGNAGDTQLYAASQTYGVNPPPSAFSLTSEACGSQVSANFPYKFIVPVFNFSSVTLRALSCFPKRV